MYIYKERYDLYSVIIVLYVINNVEVGFEFYTIAQSLHCILLCFFVVFIRMHIGAKY